MIYVKERYKKISRSYRALCITILPTHGEVQPKGVAVDNVNVACFTPAKGVDPAAEGFVCPNVDNNPGVLAVHRDVVAGALLVAVDVVLAQSSVDGVGLVCQAVGAATSSKVGGEAIVPTASIVSIIAIVEAVAKVKARVITTGEAVRSGTPCQEIL